MKVLSRSLAAVLVLSACAERLPPRSTVQADAIAKSDLEGVWYFRQTVVGVPFTTGFTFIGEQGENELEKIRWDIQEHVLTARRTYEFVRGTERGEPSHGEPYLGAPVAAFRIVEHFDIVREYNPSTGEEYDRIVENQERKWFERKFIRVDWSQNLISSFQFLAGASEAGVSPIKQEPAPYYVSDPKDADAMRLERPAPDQPASYLEVTQKIIASPESVAIDGYEMPLCYLEYATRDCASQTIKIRNSFLRATWRDYEPWAYDDHAMDRFGYFTTARVTYNRQYGTTETGRVRLINRFNLWQRSLTDKTCRTDRDCSGGVGARCVTELFDAAVERDGSVVGRCSLPYAARNLEDPNDPSSPDLGPRKIVYHLNDSFPPELVDTARRIAEEYDQVFRATVKALTGREVGQVFVLCTNNPVREGDPAECGPPGTHARIGDLRYNLLYWVDEPTSAQLLGYGPSSHDPETGETISATAFVYGAMIDEYAAMARDVVRLVNGEIPTDQFIRGVDVKAWVQQTGSGQRSRTIRSQADVEAMADAMDFSWTSGLPRTPSMKKGSARAIRANVRERSAALARSSMLGADRGLAASRLARLQGTAFERLLANGEMLLARGMDPRLSPASVDLRQVAPLKLANPEVARYIRRARNRLASHAVDLAASFDDAVLGLAIQQKGRNPIEVWRALRAEIFRSTALHEIGHTLGLRHNFAGSYDALNYPKTYWDLRTANGSKQPRPRYLDPESKAELEGVVGENGLRAGIAEFQHASIMDYGAKFNSDFHGLGKYDRAAIKFGYGRLVEVFNQVKDAYLLGALQATVTFGEVQPLLVDCAGQSWISVHYTRLPQLVNLEDRSDVELSRVSRSILRPDCAFPDVVEHDDQKRLVVPYKFCSDELEGATPGCAAYDRGADVYEVARGLIDEYRSYYLFRNFKRDRLGFSPDGYIDELFIRYLDPLRSQMQFYALYRADFADAIPDGPNGFWRSPDGWGPFTVAVTEGFDLLGEILTTPEPGPYYRYTLDDGREAYLMDPYGDGPPAFTLSVPQARYFSTAWEYDSGYYWYERVAIVGSFLDKVAALAELTDPETYFLGKDLAADARQFAINYYRLFPRQLTDVFGATLTDRWDRLAPVYDGTRYVARPISQPITIPPAGTYPVDPQIGFSVQLYAATFGHALVSATFDQTFADSARVFLEGNGDGFTTSLPKVTFTDPKSGKVYAAVSYKQGVIETGIGARMIARANELAALAPNDPYAASALERYVQLLDVARSLSSVYANPVQ